MQCADCGRRGAIGIRRQMGVPLRSGVETTVMLLECDGLVPLDGEVGTEFQWTAVSEVASRIPADDWKSHNSDTGYFDHGQKSLGVGGVNIYIFLWLGKALFS